MLKKVRKSRAIASVGIALMAFQLFVGLSGSQKVYATTVQSAKDELTRHAISTAAGHTITFQLSASETFAAGETIIVDFNEDSSGFTLDGTNLAVADIDFNDGTERTIVDVGASPTCTAGADNIAVTVADAAGTLTFEACSSYTASSAAATITIEVGSTASGGTDRLTNPGTAGSQEINLSGTFGDDAFAVDVPIMDSDQVTVTASVDTYITFDLDIADGGGDSDAPYTLDLGELTYDTVTTGSTSGVSEIWLDLDSNAANGTVVQVITDDSNGLSSTAASDNIPFVSSDLATLSTNSVDGSWGIVAVSESEDASGTTMTPDASYDSAAATDASPVQTSFGTTANIYTTSGPVVSGSAQIEARAVAGRSTAAASDYTNTLTFRATATF